MFRGRFDISLDQKGRLQLPASLRTSQKNFYITNSLHRKSPCIEIYPTNVWKMLEKKLSRLPKFNQAVQDYTRFFIAGAHSVSLDKNERMLIPAMLRKYAQLDGGAVLVGMGDHLELWASETWEKVHSDITQNFAQTLEELARLETTLQGEAS